MFDESTLETLLISTSTSGCISEESLEIDTFASVDPTFSEHEPDVDIIQALRPYGVRYIRDLRAYHECCCPVPILVVEQFREASKTLNDATDKVPFCFQILPNRENFTQDHYGDLFLQDFFVGRDNRASAYGVLHFAGTFANLEYDATLRAYWVRNFGGKPSQSLVCREGKTVFKAKLLDFIKDHVRQHISTNVCPQVHEEERLLVLSYPRVQNDEDEEDEGRDTPNRAHEDKNFTSSKGSLVKYIANQREHNLPVAFPSYLLYLPNWLVHTIEEQYESFDKGTELKVTVRSPARLRKMFDKEIPAEDGDGQLTAPTVIPYRALVKTRPILSEPVDIFQRRNSSRMPSGQRHLSGSLSLPAS